MLRESSWGLFFRLGMFCVLICRERLGEVAEEGLEGLGEDEERLERLGEEEEEVLERGEEGDLRSLRR